MRVAALQYNPAYLDVDENLNAVEAAVASLDTDLLVLPELFATGYFFRSRADLDTVAEEIPGGKTTQRLSKWAHDLDCTIVAGLPEYTDKGLYNSAVVVDKSGYRGTYRKLHLYYQENLHFLPGDLGLPVFDQIAGSGSKFKLGVMICFDWYYPEVARSLALLGADIIAHPSNLVRRDCPRAMPIRALENHVFTITANRIGREVAGNEELEFIGQSLVCDPFGDVVQQLSRHETATLNAEIDPATARDRRITVHNDLFVDRRTDSYHLG
jgi:predicted amidohydrolase